MRFISKFLVSQRIVCKLNDLEAAAYCENQTSRVAGGLWIICQLQGNSLNRDFRQPNSVDIVVGRRMRQNRLMFGSNRGALGEIRSKFHAISEIRERNKPV